uniref:Superkiller complex protein 8 n=1 Tax=Paramormyrops kingsleyae TaxID=1676925 RepID=A0A3B3SPN3_9TELE
MSTQYSILFKQEHAHDDAIWSTAWMKSKMDNSETIVTGSLDDMVKVWKWSDEKLELQWTLEGHQLGVVSVDISQNGAIAASSSLDAHIRLWELDTGKQIKSMDAGPVDAWTVAFSPDSKYIATGSHLGKVNIFGVDSGKKEYSLDTRGKFILSIAYSPDGKYLASGAIDGIINIFDIATGKLLHTLEGHAMPIRSLTFSPDSQLLVTASDDGYIKIYDVQHANLAGTLSGHGSWVLNVAFSPDDTHFVSSSSDKSVKVWDVSSRTCVNTFFDHQDQVRERVVLVQASGEKSPQINRRIDRMCHTVHESLFLVTFPLKTDVDKPSISIIHNQTN